MIEHWFYNSYLRDNVPLYDYEKICPGCESKGEIFLGMLGFRQCPICEGQGKFDWVDEITGRIFERFATYRYYFMGIENEIIR